MDSRVFRFFFPFLSCLFFWGVFPVSPARAQQVPAAIKYQAVLRDVNGNVLSGEQGVDVRISIRLDDPVSGKIAYQEEHLDLTTNAFGLIHLEIGRGVQVSEGSLAEVPWGGHAVYAQVEMQTGGSGYTNMGFSELLSVPYAFMSGNADMSGLLENLEDGALPMYNRAGGNLVNSGLRKNGTGLEVQASSVSFSNPVSGLPGYVFPMEAGRKGESLVLQDNQGTLAWETLSGGGGGGSADSPVDELGVLDDGRLLYWNDPEGMVRSAPFLYDYQSGKHFDMEGALRVSDSLEAGRFLGTQGNARVGGDARVSGFLRVDGPARVERSLRADSLSARALAVSLPRAQVWIGDAGGTNRPRSLSGHVLMDETGNTRLNLAFSGLELRPGKPGEPDTIGMAGEENPLPASDSLWLQNESDPDALYAFNRNRSLSDVKVGIGLADPKARLHVEGGDVLFSAQASSSGGAASDSLCFLWSPASAALRVGGFSPGSDAWNSIGDFSVAMGLDSRAEGAGSYALGQGASVVGSTSDGSMAFGESATVTVPGAFALGNSASTRGTNGLAVGNHGVVEAAFGLAVGYQAQSWGEASIAMGKDAVARGENSISVGQNTVEGSNAIVFGNRNAGAADAVNYVAIGRSNNSAGESVVVGSGNTVGEYSIVMGRNAMGTRLSNSIVIGKKASGPIPYEEAYAGPIVLGSVNSLSDNVMSIGRRNEEGGLTSGVVLIGNNLANDGEFSNLTMIGSDMSSEFDWPLLGSASDPVILLGASTPAAPMNHSILMGIDANADVFFQGDVNCMSLNQLSDFRLKTGIRPLDYPLGLLDSLQGVSFRFKNDRSARLHSGFIAQQAREIFPFLVTERANGTLSLDYIGLIPVLWDFTRQLNVKISGLEEEIGEQARKIAGLERENESQSARIEALEAEMQAIKESLGI